MSALLRLAGRVDRWCREHLGSRAPERLIDPEGEGVYLRDFPPFAQWHAARALGLTDRRDARWEHVWMREGKDGLWYPTTFTTLDGWKFPRWAPRAFTYWTPAPELTQTQPLGCDCCGGDGYGCSSIEPSPAKTQGGQHG